MDKETQILNQYQILRDEIKSADTLNYQILGVIVAATAAILVAGFGRPDPLAKSSVFLCVFAVTIPGYKLLYGNRCRIWRIGTYMRVFLEPELKYIKWETHLDEQRQRAGSNRDEDSFSSLVLKNEWSIVTFLNTAALLAVFGGLVQYYFIQSEIHSVPRNVYAIIIGIAAILLYLYRVFSDRKRERTLKRLGDVEVNFLTSWKKLKDKIAQNR